MRTKEVTVINGVSIKVVDDRSAQLVPIKPICDLLGINSQGQANKLKDHPLFCPVTKLSYATGADGKQYEMVCIPLSHLAGWLVTIHPGNVREDVRERLVAFQQQCLDVLYEHFFGRLAKREQSLCYTLELRNEMDAIVANPDKTVADFERYLEITRELKRQEAIRKSLTKETVVGMKSLFSEENI